MKGRKCRCGFTTLAGRPRCPRCGKVTAEAEWKDSGRVLSCPKLEAAPEGVKAPMTLVLVGVDGKGPKVACWSEEDMEVGDAVSLVDMGGGVYTCAKVAPAAGQVKGRSRRRR